MRKVNFLNKKINMKTFIKIKLILECNRYEVTLHGCVQNEKMNIVLTNRLNTLEQIRQVEGHTPIKTEEDIIPIIYQTFREFGMDIAHIDRGEYIAYSIGTYISTITYYITTIDDVDF